MNTWYSFFKTVSLFAVLPVAIFVTTLNDNAWIQALSFIGVVFIAPWLIRYIFSFGNESQFSAAFNHLSQVLKDTTPPKK